MSESSAEKLEQLQVLVIFDWRDGPTEGIVRREDGDACWYFKLFAERLETETLDDRLFALWVILDSTAQSCVKSSERTIRVVMFGRYLADSARSGRAASSMGSCLPGQDRQI